MSTRDMPTETREVERTSLPELSIRFCGDSGDGMQMAGTFFTGSTALAGNDFATLPDFPAEIRAPRGTLFGVSGFQVHFGSDDVHTPGDTVNALVAMNPAGFRSNIGDVEPGGIVIVNEDEFTPKQLEKCGYDEGYNPLDDEKLAARYRIYGVPMSRLTRESLADSEDFSAKDIDRCRNMFVLGIVSWLFERPLDSTIDRIRMNFGELKKRPDIAELNIRALKAGYFFGEPAELFPSRYEVSPAALKPGVYRRISGNEATVLGLTTAARKANSKLLYASYPITPASDILHGLARLKNFGIRTFQAEDEIAAVMAAIGAAFAGDLAVTGTSGPGLALKTEAMGLAVMLELPLVLIDVQRAGPATGMPTKPEQGDLLQALYGRTGESPCVVIAAASPGDCFDMAIEAVRLAVAGMCPVIMLTDGAIGNAAEPWRIPDLDAIPPIPIHHPTSSEGDYQPYARDPETLARAWAVPGTPGLEHRVGGLEKEENTGNVSYDQVNHERMVELRAEKVERLTRFIPPLETDGDGDTLLLGWGGTRGAIIAASERLREEGLQVATAHLRHLNPMPANTGDVLAKYRTVIIPEINSGQLRSVIRSKFLVDAQGINRVQGRSLFIGEIVDGVKRIMETRP